MTGLGFLSMLCFWKADTIGYQDLASEFSATSGERITAQAIATKMQKAEDFFSTLAKGAIEEAKLLRQRDAINVAGVNDVLLADSSTITLNKALADMLPGTGGNEPNAACKLHAMFNITKQTVPYFKVAEGKESEHFFKETHRAVSKVGDLIIRDLGYFDAIDLEQLNESERFFLSRIPLTVRNFIDRDGTVVDLWSELASSNRFSVEGYYKIGDSGLLMRVVARRLPKHKWKERLEELRKEKKRPLTKKEKVQAKWNLLVTNLSEQQASIDTLAKLYALRWQQELLFKAWKSSLGIDRIRLATCKTVVLAFIWARLVYAIFMLTIRGFAQHALRSEIGLLRWFRRLNVHLTRMRELVLRSRWLALGQLFRDFIVPYCLSEKSHRTTSLNKAKESSNLDIFSTNASKA